MLVESSPISGERYCADTFNGAIATAAISAAWEIGLLDELAKDQTILIESFCTRAKAHPPGVRSILLALAGRSIVELSPDGTEARTGAGFAEVYRAKGFFYWLTHGCGEMFGNLPAIISDEPGRQSRIRRDSRAISVACRSIARTFFDPPLEEILRDVRFRKIADLGCGSGDRLVQIASDRSEVDAIGIDISDGAIAVAKEAVADAELLDRVMLIHDDIRRLTLRDEYEDVDLVTCFLMGHDFWPADEAVRILRELKVAFPSVTNLILGDTCRSTGLTGADYPMFSLGFETVHALMDQYLPTLEEWESVLAAGGWRLADQRMIDLPAFSFIYRLVPA